MCLQYFRSRGLSTSNMMFCSSSGSVPKHIKWSKEAVLAAFCVLYLEFVEAGCCVLPEISRVFI